MSVRNRRGGFTLIELMIVIAIIAILSSILIPNFVRARSQGRVTGCKSNLKNMATASETYATDNAGRYPTVLTNLTPQYIQTVPTCPSASSSTPYTSGFESSSNPDAYTMVCAGTFHGELNMPTNYPQYYSATGLIDR